VAKGRREDADASERSTSALVRHAVRVPSRTRFPARQSGVSRAPRRLRLAATTASRGRHAGFAWPPSQRLAGGPGSSADSLSRCVIANFCNRAHQTAFNYTQWCYRNALYIGS
jgi:hypothetical protein